MEEEDIYVPSDEDADPEANEEMQQGKSDYPLYDPWFESAEHAQSWRPEGD